MINQQDHPVTWVLLVSEIDDLKEHLDTLAKQMADDGRIDAEDFAVQIAHAYAHLNRIWNSRNEGSAEAVDHRNDEFTRFPTDIEPIG